MRKLDLPGRRLTDRDTFIIAEIGSNHMGDPDVCEQLIIAAARAGVDAVKMQKRDNRAMFTKTALAKPYENEFSYGKTYGEHRERLDWFGLPEFRRFKGVAQKYGVMFFATPFEESSVRFLQKLMPPMWKVASCDVTNLPLVKMIARQGDAMLISTGGASREDIQRLADAIDPINPNFALMHCVSLYPNRDEDLNLGMISTLREMFPDKLIGFSSHHPGILPLLLARSFGASIFEAHLTLSRANIGTDHGFSLEPRGLEKACEDLRRVRTMVGLRNKPLSEAERGGFVVKMGKGLYLSKPKCAGDVIERDDLIIKSPAGGLKPYDFDSVIGKHLLEDCSTGVSLEGGMIE